ncbi:ABC transporter substrate-binding protein [Marinobacter sp.]|uniref:ABC transporter substrate-binding protein n=1 Tax=Marinobacter sp. TaxID=50741 RepID=UPI0035683590
MTTTNGIKLACALTVGLTTLVSLPAGARTQGVSDDQITIGTIQDLSGPLAALSKKSLDGMTMRVDEINAAGGINGREIRLVVDDHGYQPRRAKLAAQRMIQRDRIFAMMGVMGSATAMATIPELTKNNVPSLFPFSAARQTYIPINDLQWASVATYDGQMEAGIQYMMEEKTFERPCAIYQDDEFGTEVLKGAEAGLEKLGKEMVETTSFQRGSTDFSSGVAKLRAADCDLVMIGAALREPVGIMNEARTRGWSPAFFGSAASYTTELPKLGGDAVEGYYAMSGVEIPYAESSESEDLRKWAIAYEEKFGAEPDGFSVLGYTMVELFNRAASAAGDDLTVDSLVAQLKQLEAPDLFGADYYFGEETRNGAATASLFQVQDGLWIRQSEPLDTP